MHVRLIDCSLLMNLTDAFFNPDKPGKFLGCPLFTPANRPQLFLDLADAVQVSKKRWDADKDSYKSPNRDIQDNKQQEGRQYPVQCPEHQRAGKPFDVQVGIDLLQVKCFHQAKKALITTPTRIRNKQAPNQPMIAFWVS